MKHNFSVIVILLSMNAAVMASVIDFQGFSHDTNTDIVTGYGQEWLQWDVTVGQSINQALSDHAADGWRLASTVDMSIMLTNFGFYDNSQTGLIGSDENSRYHSLVGDEDTFVSMFGTTFGPTYVGSGDDPVLNARALAGSDSDNDGFYNEYSIADNFNITPYADSSGGGMQIVEDDFFQYTADSFSGPSHYSRGIALVRGTLITTPVPEPSSLVLLLLGLLSLSISRKSTK